MIDVSIVIVSWNTRNLLRECLYSLYRHIQGVTFEVFVVDNASSDGSMDMVKEMFPQVKIIENNENLGFSKANNQAIRMSVGRYTALLNPDTLLIEDVFTPLVRHADEHPMIGAIGPKILCRDGETVQLTCARKLPNLFYDFCRLSGLARRVQKLRLFSSKYMSYGNLTSSRYVEALSGSCMIVRKEAISDVGLMDENQFMYGDEIDWCKRLLVARWRIYYFAQTSIIHYGGESSKQINIVLSIESEKAMKYYYMKHHGRVHAYLFTVQVSWIFLCKFVWSAVFRKKNQNVIEQMNVYKCLLKWSIGEFIKKQNKIAEFIG